MRYGDPTPCECCGSTAAPVYPYGEADASGHMWHHVRCAECKAHCTSDDDGNPVHVVTKEEAQAAADAANLKS
jgi:hypothetical protein